MQSFLTFIKLAFLPLIFLPSMLMAQTCNPRIVATTGHLVDNNNGMVSDPKTGLIWKKCSEGQSYNSGSSSCDNSASSFNWKSALQQAQTVNTGNSGENLGQTDWRVPNINELASIAELRCYSPAINETVFPNTPSEWYWSSSPFADYSNFAWVLYFSYGSDDAYSKNHNNRVRLVRSGQ